MSEFKLATPVAFLIFNRPETTQRVFAEIAKAKPPKLLVVADGPRANRPSDATKCAAARALVERIDWPCELLTNCSETNMGCKLRVASGLDWVFEQVPEAIILEDDCLPHPTFFRFCEELLKHYRDDKRVGMISGDNFQFGRTRTTASYYFSRYNHIWGWATWARAWQHYDRNAIAWSEICDGGWLDSLVATRKERKYWIEVFQLVREGRIDTWDYQWMLTSWYQGMISITPNVNLISNIGFGAGATNTPSIGAYANMKTESMDFPLRSAEVILPHRAADAFVSEMMFTTPSVLSRIITKIRSFTH